ncbi:MAG: hypothetical protein ACREV6_23495 [Clostridium sp.]|uniref:hypothetical protein n=1 Tax=Clostridium sp. TaxID=1506 RepID=UPI003D6C7FB1
MEAKVMDNFDYRDLPEIYWSKDTRVGKERVITEATPLRVEAENLSRRRQLWVVNDAATYIYHSTDPNFTLESGKYRYHYTYNKSNHCKSRRTTGYKADKKSIF